MTVLPAALPREAPRLPRGVPTVAVGVAAGTAIGLLLGLLGATLGAVAVLAACAVAAVVPLGLARPHLVLLALPLALPIGPLSLGPVEVVQLVAVLVALGVLVPTALRLAWRLPPWPIVVPLVGFVLIAGLATPRAFDEDLAFRLDVQLVVLVLTVLAATTALDTRRRVVAATLALVAAGGVLGAWAVAVAGPTETFYGGGVVTGRAQGVFSQPNELGLVTGVLLVLTVGAALAVRSRGARILCAVAAVGLLGGLGASLSRGAWLGVGLGILALAVLEPRLRKPVAGLAVLAVLVGGVLAIAGIGPAGEVAERLASSGSANPYDQRSLIWAEGLRLVREAPVLGHGPGGYTIPATNEALEIGQVLSVEHAHNLLLNVAVEFGLLGAVALLGLVAGLLLLVVRSRGAGAGAPGLAPADAAALVVVLGHGLVDYPLRNATCMTTVWLVLGLLVAWSRLPREERS